MYGAGPQDSGSRLPPPPRHHRSVDRDHTMHSDDAQRSPGSMYSLGDTWQVVLVLSSIQGRDAKFESTLATQMSTMILNWEDRACFKQRDRIRITR